MIRPGRFTHPAPGLTVFAQSVDDDGTIHNLFIDRVDSSGHDSTTAARLGRFERRRGAPVLALRHGSNQEFSAAGVLNFLSFDVYVFDLRPLLSQNHGFRYKLSDLYLHELVYPDPREGLSRSAAYKRLAEAHSRLAGPLYNIAFMMMALAAILGGAVNRLGYGGRIAVVVAAAVLARTLGFAAQAVAGSAPILNVLQYLIPLAATLGAAAVLFPSPRPTRPKRFGRSAPIAVSSGRTA
jgi:lipopolysaccharide export system permease protein